MPRGMTLAIRSHTARAAGLRKSGGPPKGPRVLNPSTSTDGRWPVLPCSRRSSSGFGGLPVLIGHPCVVLHRYSMSVAVFWHEFHDFRAHVSAAPCAVWPSTDFTCPAPMALLVSTPASILRAQATHGAKNHARSRYHRWSYPRRERFGLCLDQN